MNNSDENDVSNIPKSNNNNDDDDDNQQQQQIPVNEQIQQQQQQHQHPFRDCDKLYACTETVNCALQNLCIPCSYKVGLFDVALDTEFCTKIPNQRPELCPRSQITAGRGGGGGLGNRRKRQRLNNDKQNNKSTTTTLINNNDRNILGYKKGMNVLTVGDGDFTFSLSLARMILSTNLSTSSTTTTTMKQSKSRKENGILIATSYESKETLLKVYPNIDITINELIKLGAYVYYNVDATRLQETLVSQVQNNNTILSFHRIVWNFPCEAVLNGQDGQNDAMERNKNLIRHFVHNAYQYLNNHNNYIDNNDDDPNLNKTNEFNNYTGGEIHITHKTKPPYNQWKIEEVVLECHRYNGRSINNESECTKADAATTNIRPYDGLNYDGRIVFDRCLFSPYIPRKALDKKSFPAHDACIYIFRRCHLNTLTASVSLAADEDSLPPWKANVVLVTMKLIEEIRIALLLHHKKAG